MTLDDFKEIMYDYKFGVIRRGHIVDVYYNVSKPLTWRDHPIKSLFRKDSQFAFVKVVIASIDTKNHRFAIAETDSSNISKPEVILAINRFSQEDIRTVKERNTDDLAAALKRVDKAKSKLSEAKNDLSVIQDEIKRQG